MVRAIIPLSGVDGPSQGVGDRRFALVWQEGWTNLAERSRAKATGRPADRHAEHEDFTTESGRSARALTSAQYGILFDVDEETEKRYDRSRWRDLIDRLIEYNPYFRKMLADRLKERTVSVKEARKRL